MGFIDDFEDNKGFLKWVSGSPGCMIYSQAYCE